MVKQMIERSDSLPKEADEDSSDLIKNYAVA